MYFGADYYPEHWPRENWENDARMMKQAGFNVIRVAEFSWAKLESAEDQWDFSWLDEAIDVFYRQGINIIMGTPTATPPKWLMDKHPEIYQEDESGIRRGFGSRRHYCFNSEIYWEYSKKIVEKMASHYAGHPAIVAWQVDNEFTDDGGLYCYCENCRKGFASWLKSKYGSLDAMNEAWGTVFWSQTYTSWDQMITPKKNQACFTAHNAHNPGLNLDYSRFQSHAVKAFSDMQVEILKKYFDVPITHNMVREEMDYYEVGENLDVISFDSYPLLNMRNDHKPEKLLRHTPIFLADQLRGVKNKNFWMMEQQSGPCGWNILGRTPAPGRLAQWAYQKMAHGAEAMIFFRWRAALFGTEQYWYGILDHDGKPRRRYDEIKSFGEGFRKLLPYNVGSRVNTDILMIRSFQQQWCHLFQTHSWNFDYRTYVFDLHRALTAKKYNLDLSSEKTDFSGYKVVIAPAFNLMDDALKAKFEDYVASGGNLVITFRSGTKNMDNSMTTETLPGYFRNLAGIELEEFDSLNDCEVGVRGVFGEGKAIAWADVIQPVTAEVLATYTTEFYAGKPAVTVNSFGKGKCYYLGCDLDEAATAELLEHIVSASGVEKPMQGIPGDVEVVKKTAPDGTPFWFVLNLSGQETSMDLPFEAFDILSESTVGTHLDLPGYSSFALKKI